MCAQAVCSVAGSRRRGALPSYTHLPLLLRAVLPVVILQVDWVLENTRKTTAVRALHSKNSRLPARMAALASLNAYGSDSEGEEKEEAGAAPTGAGVRAALVAALPTPHGGQSRTAGAGSAAEPDAKRPRRTFQLPLPAPKHNAPAAAKSDDDISDDEDAKRFASSRKGVGLLASVSRPVPSRPKPLPACVCAGGASQCS